jgi:nitrate/nitrite-specific signal transduction histidine kinase
VADAQHAVVFQLIDESRRFIERLIDENERMGQRLARLEKVEPSDIQTLRDRARELESENERLANLYVASYRLSGTEGLIPTLEVVREVIVNLIGSEDFALLVRQHDEERFGRILANGPLASAPIKDVLATGRVAEAMKTGAAQVATQEEAPTSVLAAIPLFANGQQVGVLAIGKLLPQKPGFAPLDLEIFDLLGQQVAGRLVSGVAQRRVASSIPIFELEDFEGVSVAALPSHRVA